MASNTASMADKKKGKISLKFSIPTSSNDNENKPAAEWMSGKWVRSCTILIYVTSYSILVSYALFVYKTGYQLEE